MAGGDLFDQGGAGSRHADDEYRLFGRIAPSPPLLKGFGPIGRNDAVHPLVEFVGVEMKSGPSQLILAEPVAGFEIGERGFNIALLVADLAEGEMDQGAVGLEYSFVVQNLAQGGDVGLAPIGAGGGSQVVLGDPQPRFGFDGLFEVFHGVGQPPRRQQQHPQSGPGLGEAVVGIENFPVFGLAAFDIPGLEHHPGQVQMRIQVSLPAAKGVPKGPLGAFPILLGLQDVAEAVVGFGVLGVEVDGLAATFLGPFQVARLAQRRAQIGPRHGVVRRDPDRRLIGLDGFRHLAPAQFEVAEVDVGLEVIRIELDGLQTGFKGLVQPALDLQRHRQVVVGLGVIGLQFDDVARGGFGLYGPAEQVHDGAAVGMQRRIVVVAGDGFEDHFPGILDPALLIGDQGQHVKGFGVEVVALGHGAELDFRVRQVAGIETGAGLLQKPLCRGVGLEGAFLLSLFAPLLAVHRFIPWPENKRMAPGNCLSRRLSLNRRQP